MRTRRIVVRLLLPVYLLTIVGVASSAAVAPLLVVKAAPFRLACVFMAPALFVCAYVCAAGALSRLTLRSIVSGRFPRDLGHHLYGPRRLYAICWTAIYYCPPVYHAVLAVPALTWFTFRLFGYRGNMSFTTYPDTWIRDLPLLEIGEGSYLSNRATISPNMCLHNGKILIAPVRVGAGVMLGHATLVAPGVTIGAQTEIGVSGNIGIGVTIGERTRVGHVVGLDHGCTIGSDCEIGTRSYIGKKAVIGDGLSIPPGVVIPANSLIRTESDLARATWRGESNDAGRLPEWSSPDATPGLGAERLPSTHATA